MQTAGGGPGERCAIVTGASRGIGRAVALRLAAEGFTIVVTAAEDQQGVEDVVGAISRAGGRAVAALGDVSDPAAVRHLFDVAERAAGGVDVVVSNAGITLQAAVAEIGVEDFDRLVAVNLKGTFLVLAEAARRLRPGGRVVAVSTSLVATGRPGSGPYAATKAAVEVLVRTLAKELAGRDITVNAVAPGPVETALYLAGKTAEQIAASAALAPLGRIGQPNDIAGAVAMLVGPDGRWINGQTIRVNGGYV